VWNYGAVGVLSLLGAGSFWWCFSALDKQEDQLNNIKKTQFLGSETGLVPVVHRYEREHHSASDLEAHSGFEIVKGRM